MSTKDFLNIGLETTKGSALHSLKDEGAAGAYDFARLALSGVAVDQETFTLADRDVYEVNSVLTDTASESVATVEVGDTSITFDTAFGIAALPGDVIRMQDEYMIVIDYNVNGPSANVVRGAFGSTEAQHSVANSDTFQAAQPVAAGNFAVPIDDTAAAAFVIDCAAAVEFWKNGYSKGLGGGIGVRVENALKVDAFVGPTGDEVVFAIAANANGADVNAENFTNGTLDAAFGGGVEAASQQYSRVIVKATGTGALSFVAPFVVNEAFVTLYGADGAIIEAAANTVSVVGRMVTVSAVGALAAGVTAVVEFYA